MTQTIFKTTTPYLYNNIKASVKILAGSNYTEDKPFLYSDTVSTFACRITDSKIILME